MRLALALLLASIAGAAELAGNYELHGVREVASGLALKADGTFEFALIYGAADYSSKGKWKRDGDSVVLTADKPAVAAFRLVRSSVMKEPGVRVWVKGANGRGVENIDVKLGSVERRTAADGSASFPEAKLPAPVTISVRVYSFESPAFALKAPDNDVVFEINGEAITHVPFNNERLRIDGDTLELRFFDRSSAMRYQREGPH